MAPREIPGYFYDEVKQKYFRIQKDHVLPAGSAHTYQSVKAKQEAKNLEAQIATRQKREHDGRIKRSALSTEVSVLERRIGQSRSLSLHLLVTQEYGRHLTARPLFSGHSSSIAGTYGLESSTFHISDIGRIVLMTNPERIMVMQPASSYHAGTFAYQVPSEETYPYSYGIPVPPRSVCRIQQVSSLDTTMLASTHRFHPRLVLAGICVSSLEADVRDVRVEYDLQTLGVCDIWDLASCRANSTYAAATDQGLIILPCESIPLSRLNRSLQGHSQRTVSFMDSNPHILISGGHNARVNLTDIRSSNKGSSTVRLIHSSLVVSATCRSRNPHQILVGGLSAISLYDLRYSKAPTISNRRQQAKKSLNSIPVMEFSVPDDRKMDFYVPYGTKMVYSREMDIIVTASSKAKYGHAPNSRVTVYSAQTGRMVPSPLNDYNFHSPVTCTDMKRIRDGPESIVTLSGNELMEWYPHGNIGNGAKKNVEMREDIHNNSSQDTISITKQRGITMNMAAEWNRGNGWPD